jgi:hypothetical protein
LAQTINIAQATVASGSVGDIKIGEIVLGGIAIGQLTLQGTSLDIASGSASLQSVRTVITLDFQFDWWINLGFWSDSGSADLGSLSFALDLGNVSIPSFSGIPLSIPNIVVANLTAAVAPVTSIDLGSGVFSGIGATNAALPKDGFTLTGLGLGGVSIASVQVPESTVAQVTIQDFHPSANMVLPSVTVGSVQVPSATAADVQATTAVSFNSSASPQSLALGLGVLGGTLNVTPTAYISIGALQLQGVAFSGSIAQAILQNIGVPVDLQAISLEAIDIGAINATNITA